MVHYMVTAEGGSDAIASTTGGETSNESGHTSPIGLENFDMDMEDTHANEDMAADTSNDATAENGPPPPPSASPFPALRLNLNDFNSWTTLEQFGYEFKGLRAKHSLIFSHSLTIRTQFLEFRALEKTLKAFVCRCRFKLKQISKLSKLLDRI